MIAAFTLGLTLAQAEMGRVQLDRSFHAIAFSAPAICGGHDEVALQVWNLSGSGRTDVASVDFRELELRIVGFMPNGSTEADPITTISGNLGHNEDSVRCVSSAAKAAGAARFVVSLEGGSYRFVD